MKRCLPALIALWSSACLWNPPANAEPPKTSSRLELENHLSRPPGKTPKDSPARYEISPERLKAANEVPEYANTFRAERALEDLETKSEVDDVVAKLTRLNALSPALYQELLNVLIDSPNPAKRLAAFQALHWFSTHPAGRLGVDVDTSQIVELAIASSVKHKDATSSSILDQFRKDLITTGFESSVALPTDPVKLEAANGSKWLKASDHGLIWFNPKATSLIQAAKSLTTDSVRGNAAQALLKELRHSARVLEKKGIEVDEKGEWSRRFNKLGNTLKELSDQLYNLQDEMTRLPHDAEGLKQRAENRETISLNRADAAYFKLDYVWLNTGRNIFRNMRTNSPEKARRIREVFSVEIERLRAQIAYFEYRLSLLKRRLSAGGDTEAIEAEIEILQLRITESLQSQIGFVSEISKTDAPATDDKNESSLEEIIQELQDRVHRLLEEMPELKDKFSEKLEALEKIKAKLPKKNSTRKEKLQIIRPQQQGGRRFFD